MVLSRVKDNPQFCETSGRKFFLWEGEKNRFQMVTKDQSINKPDWSLDVFKVDQFITNDFYGDAKALLGKTDYFML
jgi:hypothetical protein